MDSLDVQPRHHVIDLCLARLVVRVIETVGVPVEVVARHWLHPRERLGLAGRRGGSGGERPGGEVERQLFLTVVRLEVGLEAVGQTGVGGLGRVGGVCAEVGERDRGRNVSFATMQSDSSEDEARD